MPIPFIGHLGFIFGIVLGAHLEEKYLNFNPKSKNFGLRIIRWILTIVLVMIPLIVLEKIIIGWMLLCFEFRPTEIASIFFPGSIRNWDFGTCGFFLFHSVVKPVIGFGILTRRKRWFFESENRDLNYHLTFQTRKKSQPKFHHPIVLWERFKLSDNISFSLWKMLSLFFQRMQRALLLFQM